MSETLSDNAETSVSREPGNTIPGLGEAVRAAAVAASRQVSAIASNIGDGMPVTRDNVVKYVQQRPLTTVLIATAAGLLAGMLITRQ
jgi:ElaB/YqjD/DUF883 family membrane-anchored ribosome-binding protein